MLKIFETPIGFLKSESLINAEKAYSSRLIDVDALKAVQDEEISKLVDAEKAADLDVITDGAFRNLFGLRDFWMWLQGVSPTIVTTGHVYQDQNSGEVIPRVTGKVAHNPNHNILNNFSFLQGKIGDESLVRMDIPAPSQFLVELVRNGWYDTSVYPSINDLASDIAKAYHCTLLDLYALGCRRILLIDPSWGRLCDPNESKRLLQGGIDLVEMPRLMRLTNENAIKDIHADMQVILYAQVETQINKYCSDVINEVLALGRVDTFMFDWQNNEKGILPFISQIPEGKGVILGIGDTKEPQLDNLEEAKGIIDKVAKANPAISVRISTKGGFLNNTDYINFSSITEVDQWRKIKFLLKIGNSYIEDCPQRAL